MLKSSVLLVLACQTLALANTFLVGQRLAKKDFDCGEKEFFSEILEKRKGRAAAREVKSAAGTDFSGRVRVACSSNAGRPQGAPRTLHDPSRYYKHQILSQAQDDTSRISGVRDLSEGPSGIQPKLVDLTEKSHRS